MKIIYKYICRILARNLISIIITISLITFVFDIIEFLRVASIVGQVDKYDILQLVVLKNYYNIQKILPLLVLISSLITYDALNKNNEIVGMQALGVSSVKFIKIGWLVSILFWVLHITLLNPLSSIALNKYQEIEAKTLKGNKSFIQNTGIWFKYRDNNTILNQILDSNEIKQNQEFQDSELLIIINALSFSKQKMYGVRIFIFDLNNGMMLFRIDAESLFLNRSLSRLTTDSKMLGDLDAQNLLKGFEHEKQSEVELCKKSNIWIADNALVTDSYNNSKRVNIAMKLQVSLQEIASISSIPEMISFWDMTKFIKTIDNLGINSTKYKIHFYKLLLTPLSFLYAVIIGYVFAIMKYSRTIRIIVAIIIGVIIHSLYDINSIIIATYNVHSPFLMLLVPLILYISISALLFLNNEWQ